LKADDDFFSPARVMKLDIEPGRRILVISDIHGNLVYLRALLSQVGFCDDDILIIDGDYLEKGPDSLGTIRFLMELVRRGNTYVINGNCDGWSRIFVDGNQRRDEYIISYMHSFRYGIVYEVLRSIGIDPDEINDICPYKKRIYDACPEIWDFISTRPHAIETGHYIFTHAGKKPGVPLVAHAANELYRINAFLTRESGEEFPGDVSVDGQTLLNKNEKWVIVGHWPVVLYHEKLVNANPVIDRSGRCISLDGGCVLKDDGQLNCLIIPFEGSEDFSYSAYDPFETATVLTRQSAGADSYYIRWGDNRVEVLERGPEFSRCRHVRTGYEMDILTKYLFTEEKLTTVNDCSDYILPLEPGDTVRIVERTARGYYVKHNGISGWYFGELEMAGNNNE